MVRRPRPHPRKRQESPFFENIFGMLEESKEIKLKTKRDYDVYIQAIKDIEEIVTREITAWKDKFMDLRRFR